MHTNEDRFWANLLVEGHPGWTVRVAETWDSDRPPHPDLTCKIYAYDTGTGWSGTCAIAPENLLLAMNTLEGSPLLQGVAVRFAHAAVQQVADLRAADQQTQLSRSTAKDVATRRAMVLCMYYIAQCQTLKVVRAQYGSVRGHWLTLMYRFDRGQTIIRPAFKSDFVGQPPMTQARLKRWSQDVLHDDQSCEDSRLSRQIKAGSTLVLVRP